MWPKPQSKSENGQGLGVDAARNSLLPRMLAMSLKAKLWACVFVKWNSRGKNTLELERPLSNTTSCFQYLKQRNWCFVCMRMCRTRVLSIKPWGNQFLKISTIHPRHKIKHPGFPSPGLSQTWKSLLHCCPPENGVSRRPWEVAPVFPQSKNAYILNLLPLCCLNNITWGMESSRLFSKPELGKCSQWKSNTQPAVAQVSYSCTNVSVGNGPFLVQLSLPFHTFTERPIHLLEPLLNDFSTYLLVPTRHRY